MENKWTILVEIQFDGMEQKRKGNGMERLRTTMILTNGFGNGMEWKWKRNGISRYSAWNASTGKF